MAETVRGPDGSRWRVGRRWLPWRLRVWRRLDADLDADPGGCLDIGFDDLVVALVVLVALWLFIVLVLPILVLLIELTLLALLVLLGVIVRVVLRRPWLVDAVRLDAYGVTTWKVVGWRASGEHVAMVARRLQTGGPLPPPR